MEANSLLIDSFSVRHRPGGKTSDGAQPIGCPLQSEYRWRAGRLLIRSRAEGARLAQGGSLGDWPLRRGLREEAADAGVLRFGRLEISETELKKLSSAALVDRLMAGGISRLSAERIVAIEHGKAEPSRARSHMQARR